MKVIQEILADSKETHVLFAEGLSKQEITEF